MPKQLKDVLLKSDALYGSAKQYWRLSRAFYNPEVVSKMTVEKGIIEARNLVICDAALKHRKFARLVKSLLNDIVVNNKGAVG